MGVSINVSGHSIGDETFIQQFTQNLKVTNLRRHCVSVELTEQAAIANLPSIKQMVNRLVVDVNSLCPIFQQFVCTRT